MNSPVVDLSELADGIAQLARDHAILTAEQLLDCLPNLSDRVLAQYKIDSEDIEHAIQFIRRLYPPMESAPIPFEMPPMGVLLSLPARPSDDDEENDDAE